MRLNPLLGGLVLLLIYIVFSCTNSEKKGSNESKYCVVYNALVPENDTVNYEVFARSWDGQKGAYYASWLFFLIPLQQVSIPL